jgi:hypothetical protein
MMLDFCCSNTNVQSKAALAISAFACDADSRTEVSECTRYFFLHL